RVSIIVRPTSPTSGAVLTTSLMLDGMFDGQPVFLNQCFNVPVTIELPLVNDRSSPFTHFSGAANVSKHTFHCGSQRLRIIRRNEITIHAILNQFGNAADPA